MSNLSPTPAIVSDLTQPARTSQFAQGRTSRFPRRLLWTVATLAAVAFIAFARRPDLLEHPQFWGEDSVVLFLQARTEGWQSLFRPYPSYFILAQRLVACTESGLSARWAPAFYCYSALAFLLLTAWFCLRARFEYLMDFRGKMALALALPLATQSGETFAVLIGCQWTLAPLLLILILQDHTRKVGAAIVDFLGLVLAGLTGPFIVLFAPWFLLRLRRVTGGWSVYNVALVTTAWSLAVIQIWAMYLHPAVLPHGTLSTDPHQWLKEFGFLLPGGMFFGEFVPHYLGRLFWIISPGLLVSLGWALWTSERQRCWAVLALVGTAAAVYLGGVREGSPRLIEQLTPFGAGGRFFNLPYLFAAWMGIILYYDAARGLQAAARVALAMILLASASRFTFPALPNLHWAQYTEKLDAGKEQQNVVVLPDWTLVVPAKKQ